MSDCLRVIVLDDDSLCRKTTTLQLRAAGYVAEAVETGPAALELLERGDWDVLLTDLRMPGMDGITLLGETRSRFPGVEVMLMTAYGTVEGAVSAMQKGATDYLTKPFRFAELDLRLRRLAASRAANRQLTELRELLDPVAVGGIIGASPGMKRVHDRIRLFASHGAPVLVTGETGTGKELVSRALHDLGPRSKGRFVPVACGAIPRDLAESFFLGHEKGSFTGAHARRRGVFEQADGGTLLLDDVDDLPPDIQVKLLRVLQEGRLTRVGGDAEVTVDVRIIATSKIDLSAAFEAGRFRSDLYFRLRGLEINLPPLRDRGDDVLLLARHFLRVLNAGSGSPAPRLSSQAVFALRSWRWPGNVRELRRAMEAACALAGGGEIGPETLPLPKLEDDAIRPYTLRLDGVEGIDLVATLREFENQIVSWAMNRAGGQQTRAAEILSVPRTSLQTRLTRRDREG